MNTITQLFDETYDSTPKDRQLRVWHIPQVPGKPFYVLVNSVDEAARVLRMLAEYDLFQFDNNIKPDYSNAQGLEIYIGDDWWECGIPHPIRTNPRPAFSPKTGPPSAASCKLVHRFN